MELTNRLELWVIAVLPFVYFIYAIFWMREMRSLINRIDTRLRQTMEQSQRHHQELIRTSAPQDAKEVMSKVEKLPPIKG